VVIERLFVVRDAPGLARLRPGDVALALGEAARLPAPDGVRLYADAGDRPLSGEPLDAAGVVALLLAARRIVHW
jgi:hypothetical protein